MREHRHISEITGYLGYSSGISGKQNPYAFRVYESDLEELLSLLPRLFPTLRIFFESRPMLISCYPAFLGLVQTLPVVDTYLRQDPFSRALLLAHAENRPVIILGQPLSTAEMLYRHRQLHGFFPSRVLVALGGYYCPQSLELFMSSVITDVKDREYISSHAFVYGYGLAEVGAGCFLGMRHAGESEIYYQLDSPKICIKIEPHSDNLYLRLVGDTDWIDTGDLCFERGQEGKPSYIIRNHHTKLAQETFDELESWSNNDWERRTGYVVRSDNRLCLQLRIGVQPFMTGREFEAEEKLLELEFYEFARKANTWWTEKPRWG